VGGAGGTAAAGGGAVRRADEEGALEGDGDESDRESVASTESSETIVAPELGSTASTMLPPSGAPGSTSTAAPWFQADAAQPAPARTATSDSEYQKW
jgi:hypothetical protein